MSDITNMTPEEESELSKDFNLFSLMGFVFPSVFAFVFIAVYQMVDGYFIKKFVGELAIAAVDLYYPVISLFIAIGIMLGTGGNAVIVKKVGEGKVKEAGETFSATFIFTVLLSVGLSVICIAFDDPIMKMCGATAGNIEYLRPYYRVLSIFAISIILQSELGILIIGEGKSVIAAIVIIVGGVLNCVLDYIFMSRFDMGIMGAAVATVIGYMSTIVYAVYYYMIGKKSVYTFKPVRIKLKEIGWICFNGSSDMVSNLAGGVTALMMNHLIYKYYGEIGVSALTIILYFNFFMEAIFMGMTSAVEPIFSYHYGTGNTDMRKRIFKLSNIWIVVWSVVIFVSIFIFNENVVGVFFDKGTKIFDITLNGLMISLFACVFLGFNTFFSGLFTAFSNGLISATLSFVRSLVILVLCLLILPKFFGGNGVWAAWPVAEVLSMIVCIVFILKYKDKYEYM